MKDLADALTKLMDVAQRALIWIVVAVVLLWPQHMPLLDRFVIETSEINILGQTFKVVDTRRVPGASVPGLTVKDGKVLLNGEDISLLLGERDRLRNEIATLTQEKLDLAVKLGEASEQVAALARAPAAAPQQRELERLAASTQAAAASVMEAAMAANSTGAGPSGSPVAASLPTVVVSGDTTASAAADEVKRASGWARTQTPAPDVRVYLRNGSYRTTVMFASQDAAQAGLMALRKVFSTGPYLVDLRSWCPAGIGTAPRQEAGVPVTDCRF